MKKALMFSVLTLVLLGGIGLMFFEEEASYDICQDKPMFGLKYSNCDTIECVEFHEETKQIINERYCD